MSGKHHDKVVASIAAALEPMRDGMTVLVGGFGLSGNAEALIAGVLERGVRDLTLVSNNAGNLGKGLARWLQAGIIKKVICSYIGNNEDLHTRMASGEVAVEITPQGTLAECDHLVDVGAIDPDDVHLPGIFVHRIIHVPEHENAFEYRTVRKRSI